MRGLRSPAFGLALGLSTLLSAAACNKPAPDAETPQTGPKVVVEEPGDEPAEPSEPADTGGVADDGAPEFSELPDGSGLTAIVAGTVPCSSDADCVPASCCHPTSCVAAADAPDCKDTMCTMDCKADTMDCYGGCLCQEGMCAAKIWRPPAN